MKRIMVAVPTDGRIDIDAEKCIRKLEKDMWGRKDISVDVVIEEGTVIHNERQDLAEIAIENKYDYVLWIDSDMVFDSDILLDLIASGKDIVTGICFMRKMPYEPCIYKKLRMGMNPDEMEIEKYLDYPRDKEFQIEGCGLAMCLVKTEVLKRITDEEGHCFYPIKKCGQGFGEDLSFCIRARKYGYTIWANPMPIIGHISKSFINAEAYWRYREVVG